MLTINLLVDSNRIHAQVKMSGEAIERAEEQKMELDFSIGNRLHLTSRIESRAVQSTKFYFDTIPGIRTLFFRCLLLIQFLIKTGEHTKTDSINFQTGHACNELNV